MDPAADWYGDCSTPKLITFGLKSVLRANPGRIWTGCETVPAGPQIAF